MKRMAIAVWGTAGIGKTSTIRRVFDKLNIEGQKPDKTIGLDICAIINLSNGKKIGIESLGDPTSAQPEWIDYLVRNHCDIIVCACRTKGDTVEIVTNLANHDYNTVWISPFTNNSLGTDVLNDISANAIINLIERYILIA